MLFRSEPEMSVCIVTCGWGGEVVEWGALPCVGGGCMHTAQDGFSFITRGPVCSSAHVLSLCVGVCLGGGEV